MSTVEDRSQVTLLVMSLISALLILVMSVPRIMGDLVMAQIAK